MFKAAVLQHITRKPKILKHFKIPDLCADWVDFDKTTLKITMQMHVKM